MAIEVKPLHYVTVEFRLYHEKQENQAMEASGQHRFLYGVESWIEGIDQRLEGLTEGEYLELMLESEAAAFVASQLLPQDELSQVEKSLVLELKIVEIIKAEPKEVVQALAATVHCCDHCGDH